jgi:hypothetical protein
VTRPSRLALMLGTLAVALAWAAVPSTADEKQAAPPPEKQTEEYHPGGPDLADARKAFLERRYKRAIKLAKARVEGYPEVAWRIVGASSCSLKDERGALEAYGHVDAEGKALLQFICDRAGISLK